MNSEAGVVGSTGSVWSREGISGPGMGASYTQTGHACSTGRRAHNMWDAEETTARAKKRII